MINQTGLFLSLSLSPTVFQRGDCDWRLIQRGRIVLTRWIIIIIIPASSFIAIQRIAEVDSWVPPSFLFVPLAGADFSFGAPLALYIYIEKCKKKKQQWMTIKDRNIASSCSNSCAVYGSTAEIYVYFFWIEITVRVWIRFSRMFAQFHNRRIFCCDWEESFAHLFPLVSVRLWCGTCTWNFV